MFCQWRVRLTSTFITAAVRYFTAKRVKKKSLWFCLFFRFMWTTALGLELCLWHKAWLCWKQLHAWHDPPTNISDWLIKEVLICLRTLKCTLVCVRARMQRTCHEITTLCKSAPTTSRSCWPHFVLCSALRLPFWSSCGVSRTTAEWPLPGRESTHSHGTHSIELGWIDASFLIAPFLSPSASLVKAASTQPCCELLWL